MVNLNVNTMMNYKNLLGSATKISMLIPKYYDQWADQMEDYLNGIDEDLWRSIDKGPQREDPVQVVGNAKAAGYMVALANKQKTNDKKCLRELRGALLPVVYNYVHGCETAQEIWDALKESYQGNERKNKSSVTKCLSELVDFNQKENENIVAYYDMMNDLIFKCIQHGVNLTSLEFNLTFFYGLRK